MNKKDIKLIQAEVANLDKSIKNMNARFNELADRRDAGKITAEHAQARLDDYDHKIYALDCQRANTIHIGELLGISYHDLLSVSYSEK